MAEGDAQQLAIAKAVRDALVDHTLLEHAEHLKQINGSQRDTAESLRSVEKKVDTLVLLAQAHTDQSDWMLKRWQFWIGVLGVIAAYGTMVVLFLAQSH